jgi:hypothetical protein
MATPDGRPIQAVVRAEDHLPTRLRLAVLAAVLLFAALRIASRGPAIAAALPQAATQQAIEACLIETASLSIGTGSAAGASLTCWDLDMYPRVGAPERSR